jgi:hypothetical protein
MTINNYEVLGREKAVAFFKRFNCTLIKEYPLSHNADLLFQSPKGYLFNVEVKYRHFPFRGKVEKEGAMMELHKLRSLKNLMYQDKSIIKTYYFCIFNDNILTIKDIDKVEKTMGNYYTSNVTASDANAVKTYSLNAKILIKYETNEIHNEI